MTEDGKVRAGLRLVVFHREEPGGGEVSGEDVLLRRRV